MSTFKPKQYPLSAYPKVRKVDFPQALPIAYAVCAKDCGNRQFIVDGSTQVCEYCGGLMFRTLVRDYELIPVQPKKRVARKAKKARKPV